MPYRSLFVLLAGLLSAAPPSALEAQTGRGPAGFGGRVIVSGWTGGYVSNGGFSDGTNFFQFDTGSGLFSGGSAYGGAIHFTVTQEIQIGVEGVFSNQDYTRYDRDDATDNSPGTARVKAIMANARLMGAPGQFALVANGGAGFVSWDLDDEIGDEKDLALEFGLGLDYRGLSRVMPFAEYTWWWMFHEKDENIVSNTMRQQLLRAGLRLVVF